MAFIPPAHSDSRMSFLERPWVAEAGPLVAAPLEAAGQVQRTGRLPRSRQKALGFG